MPPRGSGKGGQQLVAKVAELKAVQQPRGRGGKGKGKGSKNSKDDKNNSPTIGISPSATSTDETAPPKKQKVLTFQIKAEQLNSVSDAEGRQGPEITQLNSVSDAEGRQGPEITHDAPASSAEEQQVWGFINAEEQQEPETTRAICSAKLTRGKSSADLGHGATDAGDDNSTDKNGDTAAPDIAASFDSETPTLAWGGGGSGAKQCSCDIM